MTAIAIIVMPTAPATSARGIAATEALCSPIRDGMRRSTSANATRVTVSMRIWVSARSGRR